MKLHLVLPFLLSLVAADVTENEEALNSFVISAQDVYNPTAHQILNQLYYHAVEKAISDGIEGEVNVNNDDAIQHKNIIMDNQAAVVFLGLHQQLATHTWIRTCGPQQWWDLLKPNDLQSLTDAFDWALDLAKAQSAGVRDLESGDYELMVATIYTLWEAQEAAREYGEKDPPVEMVVNWPPPIPCESGEVSTTLVESTTETPTTTAEATLEPVTTNDVPVTTDAVSSTREPVTTGAASSTGEPVTTDVASSTGKPSAIDVVSSTGEPSTTDAESSTLLTYYTDDPTPTNESSSTLLTYYTNDPTPTNDSSTGEPSFTGEPSVSATECESETSTSDVSATESGTAGSSGTVTSSEGPSVTGTVQATEIVTSFVATETVNCADATTPCVVGTKTDKTTLVLLTLTQTVGCGGIAATTPCVVVTTLPVSEANSQKTTGASGTVLPKEVPSGPGSSSAGTGTSSEGGSSSENGSTSSPENAGEGSSSEGGSASPSKGTTTGGPAPPTEGSNSEGGSGPMKGSESTNDNTGSSDEGSSTPPSSGNGNPGADDETVKPSLGSSGHNTPISISFDSSLPEFSRPVESPGYAFPSLAASGEDTPVQANGASALFFGAAAIVPFVAALL
ncbi:hypothetical protein CJU90_6618 [Yarrowia sp. C11]|nr:hypothetical protein CJU90_6618 [Yarrowia sp. C11]KAG5358729.1 hypothetical protein CKK34_4995 [Yarrowia sp. E02]